VISLVFSENAFNDAIVIPIGLLDFVAPLSGGAKLPTNMQLTHVLCIDLKDDEKVKFQAS
jgi:hypothetical protein